MLDEGDVENAAKLPEVALSGPIELS